MRAWGRFQGRNPRAARVRQASQSKRLLGLPLYHCLPVRGPGGQLLRAQGITGRGVNGRAMEVVEGLMRPDQGGEPGGMRGKFVNLVPLGAPPGWLPPGAGEMFCPKVSQGGKRGGVVPAGGKPPPREKFRRCALPARENPLSLTTGPQKRPKAPLWGGDNTRV